MSDLLGILVATDKHLGHVINLTNAAREKGKKIEIFFTGAGVRLTQDPRFGELVGKAKLSVCDTSFREFGFSPNVAGVGFEDFVTQARNAEMIKKCDRYVIF